MAWNDPGKNRNPWGNRPDRGAADLDEALRNLQRKLSQMFGGKGGGGDDGGREDGGGGFGGGSNAMRGFGFSTVALVLLVVWLLTGTYQVDQAEKAVVTRFGQYVSTAVLRAIRAGAAYVNVHTATYPTGEIRGQLR